MLMETKNFNNLEAIVRSLPSHLYRDGAAFDLELKKIWYQNWIFAAHISELPGTGDFLITRIGDQEIVLVKTTNGINGFYNTCRHRGAALCIEDSGQFPGGVIRCPYHHWTYSLEGALVQTPRLDETLQFDHSAYSLYPVNVKIWEGCIFVNLSPTVSESLGEGIQPAEDTLANWDVASLKIAHRYETVLNCNWKIIWENFLECYHCPGIHRDLCNLVPIYQRSFMEREDERGWEQRDDLSDPKFAGGLSHGNYSWTTDGQLHGEPFPNLTAEEFAAGYVYAQLLPSMFIVGHPDYVRMVWLRPLSPEQTCFSCYWLLPEASLERNDLDLASIVDFGMTVIEEDARVCELNQRGLKSLPHRGGQLVPQEYDVLNFHDWLRAQMNSVAALDE